MSLSASDFDDGVGLRTYICSLISWQGRTTIRARVIHAASCCVTHPVNQSSSPLSSSRSSVSSISYDTCSGFGPLLLSAMLCTARHDGAEGVHRSIVRFKVRSDYVGQGLAFVMKSGLAAGRQD